MKKVFFCNLASNRFDANEWGQESVVYFLQGIPLNKFICLILYTYIGIKAWIGDNPIVYGGRRKYKEDDFRLKF